MNIKILDSWLREFLDTKASPLQIGDALSLTSISAEHIEKVGNDYVYDFEVTTNRPDLMSVVQIAREATTVLNQEGIKAKFIEPRYKEPNITGEKETIDIINDPKLANRILGIVMEVTVDKSPVEIKKRIEASDIRSLNNVIDVTNYVMVETGHPTHVFDFDRLNTKKLTIRESKKGEEIATLDKKKHILPGGDIIAVDDNGRIVDLLGIMGLENSVVTDQTKRIFFFIDNLNPIKIRKTSMSTGIRTEAAVLNEKGLDPELSYKAFLRGIELFEKIASGRVISKIIDIYPNKPKEKTVRVTLQHINDKVGIEIPAKTSISILENLGFGVTEQNGVLTVTVPTSRINDVEIPEDIIEEVARIYGYHNIPSILPPTSTAIPYNMGKDQFYWESRIKHTLKDWGFIETYTYSMISEILLETDPKDAVTIQNPLTDEGVYLRTTLITSLLEVSLSNKTHEEMKLFEIANVYHKRKNDLPLETRMLSGFVKSASSAFYVVKGIIEQLFSDLGIQNSSFRQNNDVDSETDVYIGDKFVGNIQILIETRVIFELDFEEIINNATLSKVYNPVPKFPPVIEDITISTDGSISYGIIVSTIKQVNKLIREVELLDTYKNKKTFRIYYQDKKRNLTNADVKPIREQLTKTLQKKLKAHIS